MEKLKQLLKNFDIPEGDYHFETISNGLINDTFLVLNGDEPRYVLQKLNTAVFSRYEILYSNLAHVLPVLKDEQYISIKLITSSGRNYFQSLNGEVWRMMNYLPDTVVFNTTDQKEVAREAGRILGNFHQLTQKVNVSNLGEVLQDFHKLSLRVEQFKTAKQAASKIHLDMAAKDIELVEHMMVELLLLDFNKLPLRVCHNDTKLNNILFSKNLEAKCFIDLDTIMPGYFLYDFGDLVRTVANPAREDEQDLSKIKFDKRMFGELIAGLTVYYTLFEEAEKETMAYGPVLMPFLHGIRALTDFLENNKYYKVAYPTQNLDRSRSLLKFSSLALQEVDFMKQEIADKMKA